MQDRKPKDGDETLGVSPETVRKKFQDLTNEEEVSALLTSKSFRAQAIAAPSLRGTCLVQWQPVYQSTT